MTGLLDGLLDPVAVTVVGASPNGFLTEHLLRNLANHSSRYRGQVNFVNPSYKRLFGRPCLPDVTTVQGELGVLFLLVSLDACLPVLESLRRMPRSVVIFAEEHPGTADEATADAIAEWGWAHGVPILGPQSNGLVVPASRLLGLVVPVVEDIRVGKAALLSQSGGVLGGMVKYLSQHGVGIQSAFEFGTSAMLSMETLSAALLEREDVETVAIYADGVTSLPEFAAMLKRGAELSKVVTFMIGGQSDAGSRAAASHSGMAASPRKVLSGLAEQYGALQAHSLDELVWSVEALAAVDYRKVAGDKVLLLSDSGGANIAMADAIAAQGLPLSQPGSAAKKAIGLPVEESANPVDFGSQSMGQAESVNRVIAQLGADERYGVAAFASILGLPRDEQSTHLGQIVDFAEQIANLGKIPLIASLFPFLPTATRVDSAVIGMGSTESAVKLRALSRLGRPASATALAGRAAVAKSPEGEQPTSAPRASPSTGQDAMDQLLGIPLSWPRLVTVTTESQVADAASTIGFPVVVKSEAGLAHRASVGGVLRGIERPEVLRHAVAFMLGRFGGPVSLNQTIEHDREYFIGASRVAGLTTLLFGTGGGRAEETAALRVAPVTPAELDGLTEPSGADAAVLARVLTALQDWILDHEDVESVDLNPVVVVDGSAVALDAKIQRFGDRER